MTRKLVVVAVAVALALLALPASADSGSITDKSGDTVNAPAAAKNYDIVKAGWGHGKNGRVRHWVVVAGTIGRPRAGMGAMPRLYLNVPGQKFDNPTCDYFVDPVPPGVGPNKSDHWKYYVHTCSNAGSKIVGSAVATRPTAHKIAIEFNPHAIGNPAHYGWAMAFPSDGDNPAIDRAPNKGYKAHVLR